MGNSFSYSKAADKKTRYFNDFINNPDIKKDCSNEVYCITGTTSGTGYILAKHIVQLNGTVCLLNRDSDRSVKAYEELQSLNKGKVYKISCDLTNFSSVKKAADEIKQLFSESGINGLINNAGVMALNDTRTEEGYDIQMHTNHLSHFLLTKELFPLLCKTNSVIVNHSSESRKNPNKKIDVKYLVKSQPKTLGGDSPVARFARYQQTKLANCVFTFALHDKIQASQYKDKIKVLVAHPG